MSWSYDVVVLGSGVAGGVAARKLKEEGMSVAMVEPGPLGGTCPLRGCEPKKVLFDAVDAMVRCTHHNGQGLQGKPELDWQELIRFKNTFTDPVSGHIEKDLARRGIDLFPEQGRFVSSKTIEAGEQQITGDRIVICTGATSRPLKFSGQSTLLPVINFLISTACPIEWLSSAVDTSLLSLLIWPSEPEFRLSFWFEAIGV